MLVRLFYVSVISSTLDEIDVQVIMGASQVKNRRLDLTGMLIQTDGHFLQIIEGRQEAVAQLMASVLRDRRHNCVRQVLQETITRRAFAQWAMVLCKREDLGEELANIHIAGTLSNIEAESLIERVLPRRD